MFKIWVMANIKKIKNIRKFCKQNFARGKRAKIIHPQKIEPLTSIKYRHPQWQASQLEPDCRHSASLFSAFFRSGPMGHSQHRVRLSGWILLQRCWKRGGFPHQEPRCLLQQSLDEDKWETIKSLKFVIDL